MERATAAGLSVPRMAERLETGAANAWEERDWVRSDLRMVAGQRRLDLREPGQGRRVAEAVQGFYDATAQRLEQAVTHEAVPENARLVQILRQMGRIMQADGRVTFHNDTQAARFAEDLRQHYGAGIVAALANGQTEALARDVGDETERRWIARAVVSAAKAHGTIGLTLREARAAERRLAGRGEHSDGDDWER